MDACGKRGNLQAPAFSAAGTPAETWRLCSACAGDYEDPDRTAPPVPDEEEEVCAYRSPTGRESDWGSADEGHPPEQ